MLKTTTHKLALLGLFLCIGLIVHFFEFYISIPIGGYLLKPGLSNIVVLFTLFTMGFRDAVTLSITRGLLSLLFEPGANILAWSISFGGIVLSLLAMKLAFLFIPAKPIKLVSVIGAIFHNIGQLIVILVFVHTKYLLYYLPLLIVSGFFGGYITGWITEFTVNKIQIIVK